MPRGRPVKSQIRKNIIEILYIMKEGYAYEIYKAYINIFPKVTMRSIYYHLKKGEALQEFVVSRVMKEKGDYSWGSEVEKIYYTLGPEAHALGDRRVKEYFDTKESPSDSVVSEQQS